MRINRSDKVAEETLVEIRHGLRTVNCRYAFITPYHNGREVGHVLHLDPAPTPGTRDICFTYSEHRNSDYVVVYTGDFMTALQISERSKKLDLEADAMYEGCKLFQTPKLAAKFIVREVKKAIAARKAS